MKILISTALLFLGIKAIKSIIKGFVNLTMPIKLQKKQASHKLLPPSNNVCIPLLKWQINHIKLPNNIRKIKHFEAKPIAP